MILGTPGRRKDQWASLITKETVITPFLDWLAPWIEETEAPGYLEQQKTHKALQRQRGKVIKKRFVDKWQTA